LSKSSVVSITKPRYQRAIEGVKPTLLPPSPTPYNRPATAGVTPIADAFAGPGAAHQQWRGPQAARPGWMLGIHGMSTFSSKKGMKFTFW